MQIRTLFLVLPGRRLTAICQAAAGTRCLNQAIVMPATGGAGRGTIWLLYASDKISTRLTYQWHFNTPHISVASCLLLSMNLLLVKVFFLSP